MYHELEVNNSFFYKLHSIKWKSCRKGCRYNFNRTEKMKKKLGCLLYMIMLVPKTPFSDCHSDGICTTDVI